MLRVDSNRYIEKVLTKSLELHRFRDNDEIPYDEEYDPNGD
jgi:hypothetical protein